MTYVIKRVDTFQGHAVPNRAYRPYVASSSGSDDLLDYASLSAYGLPYSPNERIPLNADVYEDPEIVYDYAEAYPNNGDDFELGATVQNNFTPPRWLRCFDCEERVREDEVDEHDCGFYEVTEAYMEANGYLDDEEYEDYE